MGLGDELLEDAHYLADKGAADQRESSMRRAISTAYYAVFHLFVEDFVEHWEFPDQRARLGRMFNHGPMRSAAFAPKDKRNPTLLEKDLIDVITALANFRETAREPTTTRDGSWLKQMSETP